VIEKNIDANEKRGKKGQIKKQYHVSLSLKNFPASGLYVEYDRPDQDCKGCIMAKCSFFGKPDVKTLYQVWLLWEHIDDEKVKKCYFSTQSAKALAEQKARELAFGLGKKYGITPIRNDSEYHIKDNKTNNMLIIAVVPAGEGLRWIFGSGAIKKGYFVSALYINVPLFNIAQLQYEMKKEKDAERAGRESGL